MLRSSRSRNVSFGLSFALLPLTAAAPLGYQWLDGGVSCTPSFDKCPFTAEINLLVTFSTVLCCWSCTYLYKLRASSRVGIRPSDHFAKATSSSYEAMTGQSSANFSGTRPYTVRTDFPSSQEGLAVSMAPVSAWAFPLFVVPLAGAEDAEVVHDAGRES